MVDELKVLIDELTKPQDAMDIAIGRSYMCVAKMEDEISEVTHKMYENNYSHVPILDEHDILVGVISENTFFSYLVEKTIDEINSEETIKKYIDFLPIEQRRTDCYKFVSRNETQFDIMPLFQKSIYGERRLACVFVTTNGNPNEAVLGMITPWDMLDSSFRKTAYS